MMFFCFLANNACDDCIVQKFNKNGKTKANFFHVYKYFQKMNKILKLFINLTF